ncbi:MAG: hypothetical protein ABFS34_02610 [Gemmatimonadota bacterium]
MPQVPGDRATWFSTLATLSLAAAALAIGPAPASVQQADEGRGPAVEVELQFPLGLAQHPDGALYVSERRAHRVQRIDLERGTAEVIAGTGERGFSGDGGPASEAELGCPDSIDMDGAGNLYIADRCNERIRRVDAGTGIITTIAGNGVRGTAPDGPGLTMPLQGVYYVRVLNDRELLFAETDAHRIRVLDLESGFVRTVAGSGEEGFSGDGGAAADAAFSRPHVALYTANGDLLIGDSGNQRIRRVDAETGVISTVAGSGAQGVAEDGAAALEAPFSYFGEIHESEDGDLLFTEWSSGRVLRLDLDAGILEVLAGTNDEATPSADGGVPLSTRFGPLADLVIDEEGRLLVVAANEGAIRRIDLAAGTVETLAGRPNSR